MDHDRLFKTLLTTFFAEFTDLFVPELRRHLDRKSIEFLDKEIFTDIASSERHEVDLLAKARFRGKEAFFLIHVENQASAQEIFPQRMFRYFARLHEKYRLPVYPIVLFSYDSPQVAAVDRYEVSFPNWKVLDFRYRAIQLNRLNWRDYLKKPNPVASALMAKMKIATPDRPRVKFECLRMMVKLKLDKARSRLIGKFMTDYLTLTTAENRVYNAAMATIAPKEKEAILELNNEWAEVALRKMIFRQLKHRFARVPAALKRRIGRLTEFTLEDFAEALLDFKNISDAEAWITARNRA
jgi:Domain of unknown function (DUF4351)/Putative transposase, YhgA-like